jgi:CRISPR/Cas system-associated exonuclease Cas4 (RecB family)
VTTDVSSGLVTEEAVSIAGTVVRDTRYTYASTAGVVYRSAMTVSATYAIEGQPVGLSTVVSTRNMVRTTGGQ